MLLSSNSEYNVTILMKSEMFWAITRGNCCYWKSLIQKRKWRSILTWNARNFPCCDWTILLNINHWQKKTHKKPKTTTTKPKWNLCHCKKSTFKWIWCTTIISILYLYSYKILMNIILHFITEQKKKIKWQQQLFLNKAKWKLLVYVFTENLALNKPAWQQNPLLSNRWGADCVISGGDSVQYQQMGQQQPNGV